MASYLLDGLNPQQKKAVLENSFPLSIIAGAGSGKTKTIVHKIAYLIQELNIEPRRILALTFTNKSANEMKERVLKILNYSQDQKLNIYTYHSLCAHILRYEIKHLDYDPNFNIIDEIDKKQILKNIYQKYKYTNKEIPYGRVIHYISNNKMLNFKIDELKEDIKNEIDKKMLNIYQNYLHETKKMQVLDFDDLLIFTYKLFNKFPEVANKWSYWFDYVLIDEFQDTSDMQYQIVKKLAQKSKMIVVGDPDQTIYTWRHANALLLKKFQKDYPDAMKVVLEQNYRSTKKILTAANNLIANNNTREQKKLFTHNLSGEDIKYYFAFSPDDEARWIIAHIRKLFQNGDKPNNVVVLYRANYISEPIEKELVKNSINYIVYGGIRFYQRKEIKDAIAYLKIMDSQDNFSMQRMINIPMRNIGRKTLEKLISLATEKNLLIFHLIKKYEYELDIPKSKVESLLKFINLIEKYQKRLKNDDSISKVLYDFLQEINYFSIFSNLEDPQNKEENINELCNSIQVWENKNPNLKLKDYLQEIALYVATDNVANNKKHVFLMSVHAAKGLEFKNVFIANFTEGVFPSSRAIDQSGKTGLEEERRLAYVAITRARQKLFISSSKNYSFYNTSAPKLPSRFLKEIGIDPKKDLEDSSNLDKIFDKESLNKNFVVGDVVNHKIFGKGEIINIQGDVFDILFDNSYGVKSIMKTHLRRKAD